MRPLLKIMITLALIFASTFLILNLSGVLSVEKIQHWIETAHKVDPYLIILIVFFLLFSDLFIAVPTLTVMMLSGYFLGVEIGSATSVSGLMAAGICGYFISKKHGVKLINFLIKTPEKREEAMLTFQDHGGFILLFSRATPILPEVSACMAGMTHMNFKKFLFLWSLNSIPYAIIVNYAGSISSANNPKPAIYTAIALTSFLWACWFIYKKYKMAPNPNI